MDPIRGYGRGASRGGPAARRRRRCVPAPVATLEPRQLMAAGGLGINLDGRLDYVDVMKESSPWTAPGGSAVATDANGWPLADAQVVVLDQRLNQPYNGPDPGAVEPDIGGTYHLSFTGQATVAPVFYEQNFYVQNQAYNAATNTTTADVVVYHHTDPYLILTFTNTANPASATKAGVSNVRLIQPGYAPDTTQVFTNNLVNALAPFGTVRYLNVDGANGPPSTPYANFQTLTTPSFALAAGTHVITIQGLNSSGDATAFVDNVQMTGAVQPAAAVGGVQVGLANAGFESPAISGGSFAYNPTGTAWTYTGQAGITTAGSPFTYFNSAPPEGRQAAFVQNQGSISQTVAGLAAGSYTISFSAEQRGTLGLQSLQVLVDGKSVAVLNLAVGAVAPLQWSQRKLPTASSQVGGPGAAGVSWEDMIALANATNTDMWINIPGAASDDYVTQLANLIKNGDTVGGVKYAGLNPNLKVYVEYSNEVWGGIYAPFVDNFQAALAEVAAGGSTLNNDGDPNTYDWAQRRYLERTMQVATIFRSVLGADPSYNKVRPVLSAQDGNYSYYTSLLPWFSQNYGAPSRYFYGLGTTNYVNPTDYSSVDNLIASMYAQLPQQTARAAQFAAIANYYGMQSLAYEGGASTGGAPTAAGVQVSLAASRDPRLEDFVVKLYQAWYAGGTALTAAFSGPYGTNDIFNQYAIAELAQASDPSQSPRYRGYVDLSRAATTAVTAGIAVSTTAATPLSTAADSLGQGFTSAAPGQVNYWTINVPAAGFYNLNLQTAPGMSGGKVAVSLADTNVLGTYDLGSATAHGLGILALHAGLNTLVLTTINPFTPTALALSPVPNFADPGFDSPPQGTGYGAYTYNPAGSPWAFSGQSGLAGNGSAFTQNNPVAPTGTQVAFLQNQGSFSQTVAGLAAGSYVVSFAAALRAGYDVQSFQVLVDGVVVGGYRPTNTSYQQFATASFALGAGSHTVTFRGLNSPGSGDATDFLDAIALSPSTAPASLLGDSSFESATQAAGFAGYTYNQANTPWTFSGQSGVAGPGSAFTRSNPPAPSGSQVAFLQNQGSFSQTVAGLAAGTYQISFAAALRAGFDVQSFQVLVDGVLVGGYRVTSAAYQQFATASFALGAGSHTVTFRGLASAASGDATALLDAITLAPSAVAAPVLVDGGFESLPLAPGYGGFAYNPSGTPWTFSGQSGLSAAGSAFTQNNPAAPQGSQVAFLQNQGSFSQTVSGLAAGSYVVSFAAALRAGYDVQTFQVLVDGKVVGQFSATGAAYQQLSTASFALTAGSHTLAFRGLNASGDATAFIDNVALTPSASASLPLTDPSFEQPPQAAGFYGFTYNPAGSPWTFDGQSGVAGNGSAFTRNNPNAPTGNQVAFLQNQGAIGLTVTNQVAGNYRINFAAAMRAGYDVQTFQVLVDGVVVGQFRTTSSTYQRLATSTFALSAGVHTIQFRGLNSPSTGDATAFLDDVSIDPATS